MTDFKSMDPGNGDIKSLLKSPSMGLRRSVSGRVSFSENEFANRLKGRRSTSVQAVPYSLADLQKSTDNFAPGRLLGEGTVGRVYRAKYPDGKVRIFFVLPFSSFLFKYISQMSSHLLLYVYILVSGFSSEKDRFLTFSRPEA